MSMKWNKCNASFFFRGNPMIHVYVNCKSVDAPLKSNIAACVIAK